MSSLSRPGWPRFSDRSLRAAARVTAALLFAAVSLPACGPDFPNRYFDLSEAEILSAPEGYFAAEIAHLAAERKPEFQMVYGRADETPDAPFAAEGAEVERALRERGTAAAKARAIGEQFTRVRRELANAVEHGSDPAKIALPADLPAEFHHYLLGAIAWHRGDATKAEQEWRTVLALPEAERKFRSVWAAYMLGRAAEGRAETAGETEAGRAAAAEAATHFQFARSLASKGFHDSTGLAAESYGREARAEMMSGNFPRALNLYLDHSAAGSSSATVSLRWAAFQLLEKPFTEEVVRDAATRRVLVAMIVSRIGASAWSSSDLPFDKWAEDLATACEKAGVNDAPEADRLAWLAYEGGKFELAERWVALAPDTAPHAAWIRAKLALRAGDLATGAKQLRTALDQKDLPDEQHGRLSAELARVLLALNDYPASLRTWLEGGHWQDAAFVAEHILTPEELRAFVDREAPDPAAAQTSYGTGLRTRFGDEVAEAKRMAELNEARAGLNGSLRGLLGRRLARLNQYDAASAYLRAEDRPHLAEYVAEMKLGFDSAKSADVRGAAYWRAAQAMHDNGMELFGTELEPDWNIWGGYFDSGSSIDDHLTSTRPRGKLLAPTTDEMARLEKSRSPKQRFHYRYRAAEIAGWAASLMPNDSEEAAHILYTAGGWLKARDPQAANPFYQLLVIRCGNTPLGRAAAARHWFPADEAEAIAEFGGEKTSARTPVAPRPTHERVSSPPKEALAPIQRRPGPRR